MKCAHLTCFILASSLAISSLCHAICYERDCGTKCDWYGGYNITAEFLYWMPCGKELDYAALFDSNFITDNVTGTGRYQYLGYNYEPGIRAGFGIDRVWFKTDFLGSFTYIAGQRGNTLSSLLDDALLPTLFHGGLSFAADTIQSNQSYIYESFDALFRYDFRPTDWNTFRPFFGVEGMRLTQNHHDEITSDVVSNLTSSLKWHSEFKGIGLKIGSEASSYLCGSLQIYSKASVSLLFGESSESNQQISDFGSAQESNFTLSARQNFITPGLYLDVGFKAKVCICDLTFLASLGYEFLQWHNMPSIRRFPVEGAAFALATSANDQSFGFHGLHTGLTFEF